MPYVQFAALFQVLLQLSLREGIVRMRPCQFSLMFVPVRLPTVPDTSRDLELLAAITFIHDICSHCVAEVHVLDQAPR